MIKQQRSQLLNLEDIVFNCVEKVGNDMKRYGSLNHFFTTDYTNWIVINANLIYSKIKWLTHFFLNQKYSPQSFKAPRLPLKYWPNEVPAQLCAAIICDVQCRSYYLTISICTPFPFQCLRFNGVAKIALSRSPFHRVAQW